MQADDTRGEIYRDWLIVLIVYDGSYFYEIHSPEGYINRNLSFFETPEDAIARGREDIDAVITIFEGVD